MNNASEVFSGIDLKKILDDFISEISKIDQFNGCVINLLDVETKNYYTEALSLPENFKKMEKVMLHSKRYFPENIIEIFNKNEGFYLLDNNQKEKITNSIEFKKWGVDKKEMLLGPEIWLPIKKSSAFLGIIKLFYRDEGINTENIRKIENLIVEKFDLINFSFAYTKLKRKLSEIEVVYLKNQKLLGAAEKTINLKSLKQIHETILKEIINIFHFEVGFLFLIEEDQLICTSEYTSLSEYEENVKEIRSFTEKEKYYLKLSEGALAICIINDTHYYFPDVGQIKKLPMAPKDKIFIDIINPKTLFLIPIKKNNKPVGMLSFSTITKKINLSSGDIQVIESLTSFIATAIDNAKPYTLVESQTRQLEEKNEKLKELAKSKEDFLRILAHDLRGPIGTIGIFTDQLEDLTEIEKKETLQLMKESCSNMLRLIENVLYYSSIEGAGYQAKKEKINLNLFFKQMYKMYEKRCKLKNIKFEYKGSEEEIYIMINKENLWQIFNNFLLNSLKFTPENGVITVDIKLKKDSVVVCVMDTGIGIPSNLIPHLFDKFTKARRVGLKGEKTTGIGLYIVKSLVLLNDGNIWVESEEHKGSSFYVEFSIKK